MNRATCARADEPTGVAFAIGMALLKPSTGSAPREPPAERTRELRCERPEREPRAAPCKVVVNGPCSVRARSTKGAVRVDDSRVYERCATFLTKRLIGPCLERNGNGEAIRCWRPCQMELRSRIR